MKKKAFSTLALAFGQVIFKAGVIDMGEQDPDFGREVKGIHNFATPVYGKIKGFEESADGRKLQIKVVHVNTYGDPIINNSDPEKSVEIIEIPTDPSEVVEFGDNVWTDDKERVEVVCDKINEQSKAGIRTLMEKLAGKLDLLDGGKGKFSDDEVEVVGEKEISDED